MAKAQPYQAMSPCQILGLFHPLSRMSEKTAGAFGQRKLNPFFYLDTSQKDIPNLRKWSWQKQPEYWRNSNKISNSKENKELFKNYQ